MHGTIGKEPPLYWFNPTFGLCSFCELDRGLWKKHTKNTTTAQFIKPQSFEFLGMLYASKDRELTLKLQKDEKYLKFKVPEI